MIPLPVAVWILVSGLILVALAVWYWRTSPPTPGLEALIVFGCVGVCFLAIGTAFLYSCFASANAEWADTLIGAALAGSCLLCLVGLPTLLWIAGPHRQAIPDERDYRPIDQE